MKSCNAKRRRQREQQKIALHMQHTVLFISLSLFWTTKTWNFLLTRFMEEMSYLLTKNFFVGCVPVRFFSRCLLLFTLLVASISHLLSHRCDKIFLLMFFQRYLFFCYPCQCRHQNIVKTKKMTRLCYWFFSLKVRVALQEASVTFGIGLHAGVDVRTGTWWQKFLGSTGYHFFLPMVFRYQVMWI